MDELFTVNRLGQETTIQFQTESLMNPSELERIGGSLNQLVDEQKHHHLLLDFTKVKYLSSQAIGIVLTLNKKLGQVKGSSFALCGVGPQLMQLLKITRLDRMLNIQPAPAT